MPLALYLPRLQKKHSMIWKRRIRIFAAMDHESSAWLSLLESLDSPDALVDVLLDDVGFDGSAADPWRSDNRATCDQSQVMPALNAEKVVALPRASTQKRKRIRHSRPFQEIQRLRQSVEELQNLIGLHQKRQLQNQIVTSEGDTEEETDAVGVAIWRAVATRQYEFLRESQLENQRLRSQVQDQRELVKSLLRLVGRASSRLHTNHVPRLLPERDAGMVTFKRKQLFDVVSVMYQDVSRVFEMEPFSNTTHEIRDTVVSHNDGANIPPGTLLASTSIRRILPLSFDGLIELLWNVNQSDEAAEDAYKLEHREESHLTHSFVYSVSIQTPYGPVLCHGVGLRVRHHEPDQDIVITTGSMWPDSSTPAPQNAVAYDFREWVIVQPRADSNPHNQVMIRFETSRPIHSDIPDELTLVQATVLQHFIGQAHNFIVDQEQRRIDAILLGHVRDTNENQGQEVSW